MGGGVKISWGGVKISLRYIDPGVKISYDILTPGSIYRGVKISSHTGTQDRLSWRSSVKNSRQEPTPSNGSLLQSMAAPPARRVLGMRTRSFNKTGFDWLIDWLINHVYQWPASQLSINQNSYICIINSEWSHLPLVTHICLSELGHHWFRWWLVTCSVPSHYLNQCWFLVNWGPLGTNIREVWRRYKTFLSWKCIWKYSLWDGGHFVQKEMS